MCTQICNVSSFNHQATGGPVVCDWVLSKTLWSFCVLTQAVLFSRRLVKKTLKNPLEPIRKCHFSLPSNSENHENMY